MARDRDTILVVEDDAAIAKVVCGLLAQRGFEAVWAASGAHAVRELEARPVDLVLSDVRMPEMDGMQLLDHVLARHADLPVVLVTAHGSIALAVEAMKRGAADFVQKPFERDELVFVVEKALAASRAERTAPPAITSREHGLVGDSESMRGVLAAIRKVAPSSATVLVRGETGTGKELVARALHEASGRAAASFVRVHCAALPEALLESEHFGYEKGAFTGATQRKPGRIELAHQGTLFLDEIGDISPSVQVKLLRVLQERELERVGGTQTIKVDVRVIAATHRDLEAMVAAGTFREDLFYRLAVIPIVVPPLRDRPGDVARLARHFVATFGKGRTRVDDDGIALLAAQPWPGNVRQLQNFVERIVVMADGPVLARADIERELGPATAARAPATTTTLDEERRRVEREALVRALQQAKDNRSLAARILGVSRRTLYNKLAEHGIT